MALASRAARALRLIGAALTANKFVAAAEAGEFGARGLHVLLPRLGFFGQLEVLCALEKAGADIDLELCFHRLRRKLNRGALAATRGERARLKIYVPACPRSNDLARKLLAISLADVP